MPSPKFTIVTASYNAASTIRETIESIISQDFKDWEHWVIDGASKDNIINHAEHLAGLLHAKRTVSCDDGWK